MVRFLGMTAAYLGIDPQTKRFPAWMLLDPERRMIDSGWLSGGNFREITHEAVELTQRIQHEGIDRLLIGIDAPRQHRPALREYYWDRKNTTWRPRKPSEVGYGRHCEVVVKAAKLANPQWTPVAGNCPEWMELGFSLFEALVKIGASVHEVFPSASYSMLEGERHPPVSIDFSAFRPGKTDMIDACIAAYTMIEFDQGRGCEVGDDGLGTIVLPRALSERIPVELLQYPG